MAGKDLGCVGVRLYVDTTNHLAQKVYAGLGMERIEVILVDNWEENHHSVT